MTGIIKRHNTLGIIFVIFITGILVGFSFNTQNAYAEESVPEWIKVIAGAWADGTITTDEFLNAINFLISNDIIKVPGYVSTDEINCSEVCQSTESGQSGTQTNEMICNDSKDNDGDGYTDCDDFDCQGACSDEIYCTAVYDPVCGVNGVTFGNACEANRDGVEIAHEGECGDECSSNDDCSFGTVCRDGTCQAPCDIQCFTPDPVCGTDGNTYQCGADDAQCHGVEVAHPGACMSGGTQTTETMCNDSMDNDGDGYTDCDDFDCQGNSICMSGTTETMCSDSMDNDGDGFTDCDDFDCQGACSKELMCTDGQDNDSDGFTDCDDFDCSAQCS